MYFVSLSWSAAAAIAVAYQTMGGGAHFEGGRSFARRPRTAEGHDGSAVRDGSPPPARGSVGITPEIFLDSSLL
jgi:hypothetical protein